MFVEISPEKYAAFFPNGLNPFIRRDFIRLNQHKAERIMWLVQDLPKPSIGLVAGVRDGCLLSPFSAPFGGFHYRKENIYMHEIDSFADDLSRLVIGGSYRGISITFPPSIYGNTFNSKMINALLRKGFSIQTPELTNWVELERFQLRFTQRNSREYYHQALRNKLSFRELLSGNDRAQAFNLIMENRKRFGRPIYMNLHDVLETSKLWPVDFFGVFRDDETIKAAGIFYQFDAKIVFALFWGDKEDGRPLRAMDFLCYNLWSHYKGKGFAYADLGRSTEAAGQPNEGLLRFKETHECQTELRLTLVLNSNTAVK